MALATLKEVLKIASETKTAIPGFNIDNIEIPEAIMTAAEAYHCPVILTIGQGAINAGQMLHLADVVRRLADSASVPVVMHLDHGVSYEQTIQCLRAGFTSVMFDGSHMPFETNVAITKKVVEAAHAVGVSVEAELGAIGGVEDGISHDHKNLVDVNEVERFIQQVDVDALAIGIGNAHGMYKGLPELDFDLLQRCQNLNPPPLVLHGGSGIPDDMIRHPQDQCCHRDPECLYGGAGGRCRREKYLYNVPQCRRVCDEAGGGKGPAVSGCVRIRLNCLRREEVALWKQ